MTFDAGPYDLRCEWGLPGLLALGPISDAVVIVDVLSFSTAVDIVVAHGASVLPYGRKDEAAGDFAAAKGALLASDRAGQQRYSLSPASLQSIPAGAAVVLPSPNGGALSLQSPSRATFTACLRNCEAVAAELQNHGRAIAVIPAGEQWADGAFRPCLEDWIGAGAVLSGLRGRRSPEAGRAVAAFQRFRPDLARALSRCASGRELVERGFAADLAIAAKYASSRAVPILRGDRFINAVV